MKLDHLMREYFINENKEEFSLDNMRGLMSSPTPISVEKPDWEILENPQRLYKVFKFQSSKKLLQFLFEVLKYEDKTNHNASILIEGKSVSIDVYTHDVEAVTELDIEYSKEVKNIYLDVQDYG